MFFHAFTFYEKTQHGQSQYRIIKDRSPASKSGSPERLPRHHDRCCRPEILASRSATRKIRRSLTTSTQNKETVPKHRSHEIPPREMDPLSRKALARQSCNTSSFIRWRGREIEDDRHSWCYPAAWRCVFWFSGDCIWDSFWPLEERVCEWVFGEVYRAVLGCWTWELILYLLQ